VSLTISPQQLSSSAKPQEPFDEAQTLWQRWSRHAETKASQDAIIHWVTGEPPFRWTFAGLIDAVEPIAELMIRHGIRKGEVCAIILRHNKFLYPLYLAIVSIGAIPAILAYPNPRLHPDKFRQGIAGMSQRSGLDWILTEPDLHNTIRSLVERPDSTIKGVHFPMEWSEDTLPGDGQIRRQIAATREGLTSSDPLLLQHSSGTTGLQKPVLLSHGAVLQHVRYYGDAIGLNERDKVVSWLPLYHDMGLIAAFHLPLAFGIPTVQLDPFEWVLAPSILLEAVSQEGGTISWLPNFAYNMMADKIPEADLEGVNLDSWRLVINCSEPVRHESHERFYEKFRTYGLGSRAIATCFAMAETTFAVTQTLPQAAPPSLALDRVELAKGMVKAAGPEVPTRRCVSSGQPIAGCELKIVDEDRRELGRGRVGEIAVKSVSMFDGYRNYPEKTAEVICDGWYYTGDYGFVDDKECYVIGRKKDIIIVAGTNIYPEDVEDAVGKVDGVIPGRVVAFGEENTELGSEQVSVIAESSVTEEKAQRKLELKIIEAGMAVDVSISKVYLVPPRWMIKSSAGKPSRRANKERILSTRQELGPNSNDHGRTETGIIERPEVG
jgi:fatty-acyl-CoA synthase